MIFKCVIMTILYTILHDLHLNWKKLSAMPKFTQQLYGEADYHLHKEKEMAIHYMSLLILG